MNSVSCLTEIKNPLILDASVVVNLNATGFADRILGAIPVDAFVPEPVLSELQRGISMGHSDAIDLEQLIEKGLANTLALPALAQSDYIALVSGSAANSLGDGEAATIVSASVTGSWAAIDERKARKICSDKFREVKVASTLDILTHPNVLSDLSEKEFSFALFAALEVAHMQVQKQHMNWVVARIGADRVSKCLSLPRSVRLANQSKVS